jgi:hypothetical protein
LLERVAEHNQVFFSGAWSHFELARLGSLRLCPPEDIREALRSDYVDMQPMFFGESPSFDAILSRLEELEIHINRTDR